MMQFAIYYNSFDDRSEITRFTLQMNAFSHSDHSVWSPDGQFFAFSDARGLWLWDVFTPETEPRLLLPTANDSIPVALSISGKNRYVSVQAGAERFIMDIMMDRRLPFGYLSPDERLFITCPAREVEAIQEPACELQLWQLAPYALSPSWQFLIKPDFRLEWVNDRYVIIQACFISEDQCGILNLNAYDDGDIARGGWDISFFAYLYFDLLPARDFAVQGRNVAILQGDDTLIVNDEVLHLGLTSPIAVIEWLPTLFYGENPYPPH
jgi:hypothetical protein